MLPWKYPGPISRILLRGAVFRADPSGNKIYLTYDDGPDSEVTPQLLEILAEYQARATFFVVADRREEWAELIREIAAGGHAIALHGLRHRSGYWLGNERLLGELSELQGLIREAGVESTAAYRPPFGHIRPDTARFLREKGLDTVLWTHIPGDFRRRNQDLLFARAMRNLKPGDILVLHDGVKLRPAPVCDLTRRLLEAFRVRDWRPKALILSQ